MPETGENIGQKGTGERQGTEARGVRAISASFVLVRVWVRAREEVRMRVGVREVKMMMRGGTRERVRRGDEGEGEEGDEGGVREEGGDRDKGEGGGGRRRG